MSDDETTPTPAGGPAMMPGVVPGRVDPELAAALVRASSRVVGIAKDGRNVHHDYDYVTTDYMVAICGQALAAEGLALVPASQSIGPQYVSTVETRRGAKIMPCADVAMGYTLVHEGGGTISMGCVVPAVVDAGRAPDKAALGAMSVGLAYTLRGLLSVARGHDQYHIERRVDGGVQSGHVPAPAPELPPPTAGSADGGDGDAPVPFIDRAQGPDGDPRRALMARIEAAARVIAGDDCGRWAAKEWASKSSTPMVEATMDDLVGFALHAEAAARAANGGGNHHG